MLLGFVLGYAWALMGLLAHSFATKTGRRRRIGPPPPAVVCSCYLMPPVAIFIMVADYILN